MSDQDPFEEKPDTIPERSISTRKLDTGHLNPEVRQRLSSGKYARRERELALFIPNFSDPLVVDVLDAVTIGRTDVTNGVYPTLDLTPYHGGALGVSRFHAEIVLANGRFYIKDMGSTNGTRVNRIKIAPYRLVPFRSGDELRLGHFTMIVG